MKVETWEGCQADERTIEKVEKITEGMKVRPNIVILPPGLMDYVGGERDAGRKANEV